MSILRAARRGLLVVVAGGVAIVAAEAALRLAWPQDVSGSWLRDSGHGYDVNRPFATAVHTRGARRATYRIDARGFRGAPDPDAARRVLVLGDSVTFGWLINEPQTYVARIEAALNADPRSPKVTLFNAAVGGWSTAQELAYLEDRGEEIDPDAVLIFLSGDEAIRAIESSLWRQEAGGVRRTAVVRPGSVRAVRGLSEFRLYRWLSSQSQVLSLLKRAAASASRRASRAAVAVPAPVADAVTLQQALLERLSSWCRTRDIDLWVISIGQIGLQEGNESAPVNDGFLRAAPPMLAALDVPFLDLRATLEAEFRDRDRFFIPGDGHPNELAAVAIADLALPWLRGRIRTMQPRAPRRGPG